MEKNIKNVLIIGRKSARFSFKSVKYFHDDFSIKKKVHFIDRKIIYININYLRSK